MDSHTRQRIRIRAIQHIAIGITIALLAACSDRGITTPVTPPPPPGPIQVVSLTTYEGSGQAVHPDILTTPKTWGSNSAYLVVTPYPQGNAAFENPSIFLSGPDNSWTTPQGAQNPIAHPAAGGYLSDPDALYNPSTNELWLYYRQVSNTNQILLIRSTDGVQWTVPITILSVPNHQAVSPTVVRRSETDWLLWTVNSGPNGCAAASTTVELRRSTDGIHWSDPTTIPLGDHNDFPWHLDVAWIPTQNQFWALYNAKSPGSCTTRVLRFATSPDGEHWTTAPNPLLMTGAIPEFADIVYRSSLQYDAASDTVTLWYSGARYTNSAYIWHVAVQQMTRAALFAKVMAIPETDQRSADQIPFPASQQSAPPLTNATAP